jgi:hypothetical protein
VLLAGGTVGMVRPAKAGHVCFVFCWQVVPALAACAQLLVAVQRCLVNKGHAVAASAVSRARGCAQRATQLAGARLGECWAVGLVPGVSFLSSLPLHQWIPCKVLSVDMCA